jgi:hypothetical protein
VPCAKCDFAQGAFSTASAETEPPAAESRRKYAHDISRQPNDEMIRNFCWFWLSAHRVKQKISPKGEGTAP